MATWDEIRDEVAGMLADGQPFEDVISKLAKRKNEMAKANLLKAMDDMKKREQTNEELDKKWENTVWDTDVYLDDIDGKEQMTDEERKQFINEYCRNVAHKPMTKLCDTCEYLKFCARSGIEEVGCDRYKKDTTTNEEWLKSLSTEELANYIATQCADAIRLWRDMQYWTAHEKCKSNKWYVWLREIHE